MITHYDLFAGIGGFSLAIEEVFKNETIRHIFCEWEQFPTSVLRQHWPDGEFYGDIADLVADTEHKGLERRGSQGPRYVGQRSGEGSEQAPDWTIVTGGFPCQPFSHAGRRKGTADDRYQWPNMYEVIRNTKPDWVIAENVRRLVTWNEGLVLETVCADLEAEGYEVQPFIIPAVAVGAPHRRDRVWIIGRNTSNAEHTGLNGTQDGKSTHQRDDGNTARQNEPEQPTRPDSLRKGHANARPDTHSQRVGNGFGEVQEANGEIPERHNHAELGDTGGQLATNPRPQRRQPGGSESVRPSRLQSEQQNRQYPDWSRNWQEVAFATCDDAVDDGLQGWLVRLPDGRTITRPKHRQESLKAYGNGIVPQVAMQIMEGIKANQAKGDIDG